MKLWARLVQNLKILATGDNEFVVYDRKRRDGCKVGIHSNVRQSDLQDKVAYHDAGFYSFHQLLHVQYMISMSLVKTDKS